MSKSNAMTQEIHEINLSYLVVAQRLIREDRAEAMMRLGVGREVAEILEMLTMSQLLKLAASSFLLCRFRFDDHAMLSTLTHNVRNEEHVGLQMGLLLAQQPVETV